MYKTITHTKMLSYDAAVKNSKFFRKNRYAIGEFSGFREAHELFRASLWLVLAQNLLATTLINTAR